MYLQIIVTLRYLACNYGPVAWSVRVSGLGGEFREMIWFNKFQIWLNSEISLSICFPNLLSQSAFLCTIHVHICNYKISQEKTLVDCSAITAA